MLSLTPLEPRRSRPFGFSFVAERSDGYRESRWVDVHVFAPNLGDHPGLLAELAWMFVARGKLLLGIESPGLLTTLFVDQPTDGSARWITEHRAGRRLDTLRSSVAAKGARLSPSGALSIAADLLTGLATLHGLRTPWDEQVLHGDPSVAAILLDEDGRAYLDPVAGVRVGAGHTSDEPPPSGRFQHISPALICGDPPSIADEIFAIGSILGALLIGQPVFQGTSELVTLRKIMEADTGRFETLARDVPKPITDLVRCALDRRPERRFPSALAFGDALLHAAERASVPLSPAAVTRWLASVLSGRPP